MDMIPVGAVRVMARPKRATLIFASEQVMVTVITEDGWPKVLDREIAGRMVRFLYAGVQHGVGAYTEEGSV